MAPKYLSGPTIKNGPRNWRGPMVLIDYAVMIQRVRLSLGNPQPRARVLPP